MAIPRAPLVVIVLAFTAVAALAFVVSLNPAIFGSIVNVKSADKATQEATDTMAEKLDSGSRMEIAFPRRTLYSPGDTFSATLGISNRFDAEKRFYINLIQETGPEGGPVFMYNKDTGLLAPGESKISDIGVVTYSSTSTGPYSYSVVVCTDEPCSPESPGFYSQYRMNFRIL